MKKRLLLVAAAVLVSAAAAPAEFYFGAAGIYSAPLDQPYSSRFGAGISAGWAWSPRFAVELGLGWRPSRVTGSLEGLSDGTLRVFPLEASLRARQPLGSGWVLGGEAGAGWAFHSFSLSDNLRAAWEALGISIKESADGGPVVHLGIGIEYLLTPRWSLEAGLRYTRSRTKGTWSITDEAGGLVQSGTLEKLKLDAVSLTFGLKIALFGAGESQ